MAEKNFKVLAFAAIGTGVVVGIGTAFLYSRINSNLNNLVSHLQSTIKEMKDDLIVIENELCDLHGPETSTRKKFASTKRRKTVSFSSSSSENIKFPPSDKIPSSNNDNCSDTASWRTAAPSYDTDYFSPDEDDDEFYDFISTDEDVMLSNTVIESSKSLSNDVSNLANLIKHYDILIDKTPEDQVQAYSLLINSSFDNNAEILWRKAKAARNLAMMEGEKGNLDQKKDYIINGYKYAQEALAINRDSADTNKWFAILSGTRGEFLSTSDRIACGQDFKKHIDIAIHISPNDPTLYHLLGRFCFEVSQLTWIERKVASTLFGEVPSSSYEDALSHFLTTEKFRPNWKENKLLIAKCLIQLGKNQEVAFWLQNLFEIPCITSDDVMAEKEADLLAKKHSIGR